VHAISALLQLFRLGLVVVAFLLKSLTLNTFIAIGYCTSFLLNACFIAYFYKKRKVFFSSSFKIGKEKLKKTIKYFYSYCHPIVVYTSVGFFALYFDRWFLQYLYGSIEQGYFSVGLRFSNVLLIFCSSLLPVFWREAASLYHAGDINKLSLYYKKTFSFIFLLTSFFAVFIILNANKIIALLAGQAFSGAVIPLAILSVPLIYRSVIQISGTFFKATEKTRIRRNISVICQSSGLIATYFLLAPPTFSIPGLNMGSIGLAIKMASFNLIIGNICVFYICKIIAVSYNYFLKFQLSTLCYLCILGIIATYASKMLLLSFGLTSQLVHLCSHAVAYLALTCLLVLSKPNLFGIENSDLQSVKKGLLRLVTAHRKAKN